MDAEEIKILILEKIFNDTIPKIIISNKFFKPDNNNWTFFKNDEEEELNVITNFWISIFLDDFGNIESCNIHITQQRRIHNNGRFVMLAEIPNPNLINNIEDGGLELTNLNEEFKNKNLAIKKLCENMNLKSVINLGQTATKQLELINSIDGMHVGTIKHILNITGNLDITNLETRKVLLEKSK